MMKLTTLLNPWINQSLPDCEIKAIYNDSRQIKPGGLFLAYPGTATDGRTYIPQAIEAGAVAIAYEPHDDAHLLPFSSTIPCLAIPNLSRLLAPIASRFYNNPTQSLTVTGVTGTNGKTTIAYQLAQAHALLGQASRYIGTLGQGSVSDIQPLLNTTPDALCVQRLCHEYQQQHAKQVLMEVSSHALCEGRVDEVNFKQAIYTNLTQDHLDYHQHMQHYAESKARLFAYASLDYAILNQDDAYVKLMVAACQPTCNILTYGLHANSAIQASNCQYHLLGSTFDVSSPWGTHHLKIRSVGEFNIYNSLAIFGSLMTQGYAVEQVVSVMAKLVASPGRMEIVSDEPCVLVDYAHTPDALQNALTTLQQLKRQSNTSARIWVVFGCGGDRDRSKRPIMGQIASQLADQIILTSDNPRTESPEKILDDIAAGIPTKKNMRIIVDRKEAIHQVLELADKQDIILIAGKGHESYQQIGHQRHAFSDQNVVKNYLLYMSNNLR